MKRAVFLLVCMLWSSMAVIADPGTVTFNAFRVDGNNQVSFTYNVTVTPPTALGNMTAEFYVSNNGGRTWLGPVTTRVSGNVGNNIVSGRNEILWPIDYGLLGGTTVPNFTAKVVLVQRHDLTASVIPLAPPAANPGAAAPVLQLPPNPPRMPSPVSIPYGRLTMTIRMLNKIDYPNPDGTPGKAIVAAISLQNTFNQSVPYSPGAFGINLQGLAGRSSVSMNTSTLLWDTPGYVGSSITIPANTTLNGYIIWSQRGVSDRLTSITSLELVLEGSPILSRPGNNLPTNRTYTW